VQKLDRADPNFHNRVEFDHGSIFLGPKFGSFAVVRDFVAAKASCNPLLLMA
jgi:hypothetical protein